MTRASLADSTTMNRWSTTISFAFQPTTRCCGCGCSGGSRRAPQPTSMARAAPVCCTHCFTSAASTRTGRRCVRHRCRATPRRHTRGTRWVGGGDDGHMPNATTQVAGLLAPGSEAHYAAVEYKLHGVHWFATPLTKWGEQRCGANTSFLYAVARDHCPMTLQLHRAALVCDAPSTI